MNLDKSKIARDGQRFKTLSEVAEAYGPSCTYIREAIGHPEYPLPYKVIAGKWSVQAAVVFDWIRTHPGRRAPALKVPLDYFATANEPTESDPKRPRDTSASPAPSKELDVLAILESVDTTGNGSVAVETEKLKIALAESLRRHRDSEDARQNLFKGADVIKMLRSLGEVYCETVQSYAGACAADLLKIIRERFGVDLSTENAAALQILTQALCDQSNRITITVLRREVESQVEGVQTLGGIA